MVEVKQRYSDEELKEFDVLLKEKIENARRELAMLKETLSRRNDSGTENTASSLKVLEDGADTAEKENLSNMAARLQKFLQQMEYALIRIKNGSYGVCIDTGHLIPKERLRLVPHTQHTLEAKTKRN
ncbi:MAG: TraR/DksA C4-type zinc finger protein [Bacteroidota bacterium]